MSTATISQKAIVMTMADEVGHRYRELKDKGVKKIDFSLLLLRVIKENGFVGDEIGEMRALVSKERARRMKERKELDRRRPG